MKKAGEIATKLWHHVDQKREIRIPGGKSKDGNHASFGIAERIGISGAPEILVIPYDPAIDKFVLKDDDEYPEDKKGTLQREFIEETGVVTNNYIFLGQYQAQDNREGKSEEDIHNKYVFLITDYDDSNIRKNPSQSKRIYPPFWLPLPLLETFIWPYHRWMFGLYKKYKSNPSEFEPEIIRSVKVQLRRESAAA